MTAPTVITGTSGFIGSHLAEALAGRRFVGLDCALPVNGIRYEHVTADVRMPESMRAIGGAPVVVHLAALAEVVLPLDRVPGLVDTNVSGTVHVLETFQPRRFIFASSSAVYGNGSTRPVPVAWRHVNPVGSYGMSKAMSELVCHEWAQATGGSAMAFRFGNVVGRRCRGLIAYLVNHARRYPEAEVPAQCRGNGRIVRDYVPVGYVVETLIAAMNVACTPGSLAQFNIGTGRGMTNRQVAGVVAGTLKRRGYKLRINWDAPIAPGEPRAVVLDTRSTYRRFGLRVPRADDVAGAIEDAAASYLES
jgi:nucleoside-diphosphate-sugar epimerase